MRKCAPHLESSVIAFEASVGGGKSISSALTNMVTRDESSEAQVSVSVDMEILSRSTRQKSNKKESRATTSDGSNCPIAEDGRTTSLSGAGNAIQCDVSYLSAPESGAEPQFDLHDDIDSLGSCSTLNC